MSTGFTLAATLIPQTLMSFYTEDREVIRLGSEYLRIVGLSYVMMAITVSYISVLRSITMVKLTMVVAVIALGLKTVLAYLLIFGIGPFPELGVRGAAIGTAFGWTFECILLLILVYVQKTPLAANPLSFFRFNRPFAMNVLKTSMPAAINEVLWSLGITTYNAVYAHIGTDAIAAVNINATIEEMVFVLFMGLGNACAVMVGNKIGAGGKDMAFEYGRRFLILGVAMAVMGGMIVLSVRDTVIGLYPLSPSGALNLYGLMTGLCFLHLVKGLQLYALYWRAAGRRRYALFHVHRALFHLGHRRACCPDRRICPGSACLWSLRACTAGGGGQGGHCLPALPVPALDPRSGQYGRVDLLQLDF